MNAEEMLSTIERPAEKLGVKLENGLTPRILDDVKQEPGNLPLLEFALTQLWEKQSWTIDASGILRDWGSGKGKRQEVYYE